MRFVSIVSVIVAASFPLTAVAAFSDVPDNHPYSDAIDWIQEQGIATGYSDGTFRPDQSINRVELLKIAVGANFVEAETRLCDPNHIYNFPDASRNNWYAPFLCAAVQNWIVQGYPDGTFRPEQPVTYAEAAKIIGLSWKHLEHLHTDKIPFPEAKAGAPWYEVYVRHLENNGAVPSSIRENGQLLTRGEMAYIIYSLGSVTAAEDRWVTFTDIHGRFKLDLPAGTTSDDPSYPRNILNGEHLYVGNNGAWEISLYASSDLLPGETWPDLARRVETSVRDYTQVTQSNREGYVMYTMRHPEGYGVFQFVARDDMALLFLFADSTTEGGAIRSSLEFLD